MTFIITMTEIDTFIDGQQETRTEHKISKAVVTAKDMDDAVKIFKQYRDFSEFISVTIELVVNQFIDKEIPHL